MQLSSLEFEIEQVLYKKLGIVSKRQKNAR